MIYIFLVAVSLASVRQEERRIVLLGGPGGGRSLSGNTILGSEKFESGCDFKLVSTEMISKSAVVEGRQVTVVDTPGFTDAVLTPQKLYMEMTKILELADPGPHALVIVVRIGTIFTEDIKLFELLPILFGDDASKYAMVLFTGGDELRGSFDQMIKSNKSVSALVSMCGGRYSVFDNTQRGNRQQVREFLNKIDEMVAASGGEHFPSDMFRRPETLKPEWIRKLLKFFSSKIKNYKLLLAVLVGGVVVVKLGPVVVGMLGGVRRVLLDSLVYNMAYNE